MARTKLTLEFKSALPQAMRREITSVVRRRGTDEIVVNVISPGGRVHRNDAWFMDRAEIPLGVTDVAAAITLYVLGYPHDPRRKSKEKN